ncbi:MAG: hypothetical protein DHS20C08_05380 [Rhodomicrobium sp.]|nr:MAG: hypothetical protein DHS20C08_05380 [Rhodomicrobium sp.]
MKVLVEKKKSLLPGLLIVAVLSGALWFLLVETSLAFDASVGLEEKTKVAASEEKASEAAVQVSEADIEKGKQLYGNTCLFCHGPKGVGARAPSLITGHWGPGGANSDEYMMDVIMNGRSGTIMGAFKESHSEAEIKAIITYLRHEAKIVADAKKK